MTERPPGRPCHRRFRSLTQQVDKGGMPYRDNRDPRGREARRQHYHRNKQQYIDRNAVRKRRLRSIMTKLKSEPCMDCGGVFPPVAMDFDHRDPSTKLWTPSRLPGLGSVRLMREELNKCDLVCSNCHRIRHELRARAARRIVEEERSASQLPLWTVEE